MLIGFVNQIPPNIDLQVLEVGEGLGHSLRCRQWLLPVELEQEWMNLGLVVFSRLPSFFQWKLVATKQHYEKNDNKSKFSMKGSIILTHFCPKCSGTNISWIWKSNRVFQNCLRYPLHRDKRPVDSHDWSKFLLWWRSQRQGISFPCLKANYALDFWFILDLKRNIFCFELKIHQ